MKKLEILNLVNEEISSILEVKECAEQKNKKLSEDHKMHFSCDCENEHPGISHRAWADQQLAEENSLGAEKGME